MRKTSTNSWKMKGKPQNERDTIKRVGVYFSPITQEDYKEWKEISDLL